MKSTYEKNSDHIEKVACRMFSEITNGNFSIPRWKYEVSKYKHGMST